MQLIVHKPSGRGLTPSPQRLLWLVMLGMWSAHVGYANDGLGGRVMCGYQGWFRVPDDGSQCGWHHYSSGKSFDDEHCTIDVWPDVRELPADDRFDTNFLKADGSAAQVFSSIRPSTTNLHFAWMKEYGIDGVFLQRFAVTTQDVRHRRAMDQVLQNVQSAAQEFDRKWVLMYDLSGTKPEQMRTVIDDWQHLKITFHVAELGHDPSYLQHRNQPLVALWGLGFSDRPKALDEWQQLIQYFKGEGCAVMVGVPTYWRTLQRDAIDDSRLHDLLELVDVVSPWTVGRYGSCLQVAEHATATVIPDIKWCEQRKLDYLPVAFPGFSWKNLSHTRGRDAPLDEIPRLGGEFFWSQCWHYREAGAKALYVAMFDELDEATAIMKMDMDPPVGSAKFLTESVPNDHYLWLTGMAAQLYSSMNGSELTSTLPHR